MLQEYLILGEEQKSKPKLRYTNLIKIWVTVYDMHAKVYLIYDLI
jgi:hypothetical protein